ncbi:MAG: amino acid permease [Leptospiraceae bacterium]|nr:amino acid permease [Leptospiraceae bacterium]
MNKEFKRNIGLGKAILHMMGNMIGVGIFIYPILISSHLPHPFWFFLIWIIGGFIALSGALSSAELGTHFPEAGGDYVFLKKSYGKRFAFLYGFLTFFITFPGSIAIGAGLTFHYQGDSILGPIVKEVAFSKFGIEIRYYQIMAAIAIFFLTAVNHFGSKATFRLQKIVTLLPIILMIIVCSISIYFLFNQIFTQSIQSTLAKNWSLPITFPSLIGLGSALVPVYWTFAGWNSPLALGEEIEDPERTIPRAMILGPILVTILYLLFSFVFIAIIPYHEFQSGTIDPYEYIGNYFLTNFGLEADFLKIFVPKSISFLIFLIVLGNTNSAILTGSRIYVAMARDKLFLEKVGHIDPKRNSPLFSLWLQSLWSVLLLLFMNTESNLLNFAFIAITLLSVMTIFSLYLVRKSPMQKKLAFKVFGYPYTPFFYIISSLTILVLILIGFWTEKKFFIIFGSVVAILVGFLSYEIWIRFNKEEVD